MVIEQTRQLESLRHPRSWWSRIVSATSWIVIVLLAVALGNVGREASALKTELRKLRAEAGHLDVHDRSKVYAVRVRTNEPNEWAWRIYLPGNHTYTLYNYCGRMPAGEGLDPHHTGSGSGSYGAINSGEFVLRFSLEEGPDGQWITKVISRASSGSIGSKPRTSWLADRDWDESSAIPAEGQREFPRDATFDLIRLRQESAVKADDPERRTETIALWISGASAN
jgi:hypothetical protein